MRKVHWFVMVGVLLLLSGTVIGQESVDYPNEDTWWNDRVFYEIFVRSFNDSDGDGIGDFQGIIERLDYLNDGDPTTTDDLGITGIWLMPISPSPSYHGYDVTDYRAINPEYGTMADFQEFLNEAHARGIAVIIDLVVNHSSVEHPWFVASAEDPDSEYADWYVWADENPGYRGPDSQVVWHSEGDRYYYGVFWSGMPDLNYNNEEVTAEMYDISRFWLEEVGVDGFRLDAIKHVVEDGEIQENSVLTLAWLENYLDFVKSVNPDALVVGEAWMSTVQVASYVPDRVDIAFEFDLAQGIVRGAAFGITSPVRSAHETTLELFPDGQYATFLTNHDQDRVMNSVRGDVGAAKVAASIYLTIPGVPFVYYGEEIGMTGVKPDPDIRTPMQWNSDGTGFTTGEPWRAINDDATQGVNVADQDEDPASLLNHYRGLIQMRNANPALQRGGFIPVESDSGNVYAFLRHTDEQTVLVIVNMRANAVAAEDYVLSLEASPLSDLSDLELLFGEGDISLPELDANGGFSGYAPVPEIPGRGTLVIELK